MGNFDTNLLILSSQRILHIPSTNNSHGKSNQSKAMPRTKTPQKRRSKQSIKLSFIDRLQLDAQKNELQPTSTAASTFLYLVLFQTFIAYFSSIYIDKHLKSQQKIFLNAAVTGLTIHWIGFAISILINSCKYFDIIEDLGLLFMFVHAYSHVWHAPTERQLYVFGCVMLWGVRLVAFVGYRVMKRGSDFRFDQLIKTPSYNLFAWTSGGSWCWLNGFCLWTLFSNTQDETELTSLDYFGLFVFILGLLIETIADLQKYAFNAQHKSGTNNKWIEIGLWSWSRHPNYVGEIMLWTGISIVCIGGNNSVLLNNDNNGIQVITLGIISITPIFSCFFLVFTSLMLLEKRGDKKWGKLSAWKQYKRTTPVLFPARLPTMREVQIKGSSTATKRRQQHVSFIDLTNDDDTLQ